jgi:hypothetical protein
MLFQAGQIAFWGTFAVGDRGIYFFPRLDISDGAHLDFFDFATGQDQDNCQCRKALGFSQGLAFPRRPPPRPSTGWLVFPFLWRSKETCDLMLVENFQ